MFFFFCFLQIFYARNLWSKHENTCSPFPVSGHCLHLKNTCLSKVSFPFALTKEEPLTRKCLNPFTEANFNSVDKTQFFYQNGVHDRLSYICQSAV